MSTFLVTGGAGFIGSHIVDRLVAEGHFVTVIDDLSTGHRGNLEAAHERGVELHERSILDPEAAKIVQRVRPDAMLLLAAQMSVKVSMRDPLLDARTNVEGLVRMLEAARAAGTRKVVFASSGGTIYRAARSGEGPALETRERVPTSFYGLTKSVAIDYLRLYGQQHGLDYVALALGNVYGPRQDPGGEAGVVAIFARRMVRADTCVINGDGRTTRDFVYVADVADAFVRAAERGSGLINIGSGHETSVLDVHAALSRAVGFGQAPIHADELPGEVRHVCLDTTRAATELGWRARTGLDEGIQDVVAWIRSTEHEHARAETEVPR
ncbi:NAD-dependent epimerase/dehydratase family protein [Streptomyces tendae]|uniref:NAD-dependent epimerase/dehydratase family protein n=1 Tax=Streptomyces tendae TaxID=1932 RepID=UPI00364B231A